MKREFTMPYEFCVFIMIAFVIVSVISILISISQKLTKTEQISVASLWILTAIFTITLLFTKFNTITQAQDIIHVDHKSYAYVNGQFYSLNYHTGQSWDKEDKVNVVYYNEYSSNGLFYKVERFAHFERITDDKTTN